MWIVWIRQRSTTNRDTRDRPSIDSLQTATIARSIALFVLAALAEVSGAWLIWKGWRDHRGLLWIGSGVLVLGLYGFLAALQPEQHFGRVLAAYGAIFVAGSLAWAAMVDKFRPGRWDFVGAGLCLLGAAVMMYAPRD